ncbi:ATP-binding cassette domain-containing protein [Thalassobellus suaedae]|uniref:ATP-binding cassette domain-containing protein n=2 Tax=Thalassobellus suaedae TaxID=3074124 RepID=A0ABY9Y1J6_9FLAO|nr:ATP-binding cassette domain-containing protein [Flavobacteriaceae bacterium HL-DH10]
METHIAIYISNNDDKHKLLESIQTKALVGNLTNLKGALFSEIALNKFILEETRHGHFDVTTQTKNSLKNSSQGERKKALLNHIIAKNPEYIIVDNVFDSLDVNAQQTIQNTLEHLSKSTLIIQITNRKRDLLPFINTIYHWKEGKLELLNTMDVSKQKKIFIEDLPPPYNPIDTNVENLVKLNNVTVTYGERVIVNAICWEIKPGEFWQLIGPNGSGKSTLITLITGDNPKGYLQDMVLFGMQKGSGESVWEIKRNIGYFSSEMLRGFMRSDSIENMIISGFLDSIGLYKFPSDRQILIAHQWLRILNMYEIKDKSFQFLSDGHKRLVLIARAMVKQPPLLILDEPTNGLDDADAEIFAELVNKIATESTTAILYVSHRNEEKLLKPDFIYELEPEQTGSVGKLITV